jgi:hypothetical protein
MLSSINLSQIGSAPHTLFTIVTNQDVGLDNVNYVNGCQGKYKTIVEKDSNGGVMKTTVFKYQNTTYPTMITEIEVN